MKRYHEDKLQTCARWQLHLRRTHNWPFEPITCICELQAGRFRKRHALGCNKRKCLVCKYDKLMGVLRKRDLIERERLRDEA